ncbi:glycosaminoglycan xylosylkinase-like [Lineus longissimus]|uniref:glycosaminoglycan xylosylkinase-like n=1 Tax=Lineus longissimus TaxID=88925 RepID=UPI00315D49C8
MKYYHKLAFVVIVFFILLVSFIILEPEIHDHGLNHELRDSQDYFESETNHDDSDKKEDTGVSKKTLQTIVSMFVEKYRLNYSYKLPESPWVTAAKWVKPRQIHPDNAPELGAILRDLSTRKITGANVGYRGTQLKLSLTLEGGQRAAFKPKWYARDFVILGNPYAGADRHNGEIAAFHLNRILGFNRAPLVVGRRINLREEVMPIAEEKLLQTFFKKDNNTCFFGKCYYCKGPEDGVCADGSVLEGTMVLWLPSEWKLKNHPHPWRRTYKEGKHAKWETDNSFCQLVKKSPPYNTGPQLLDLLDGAAFDYLIGNADRHHYETFTQTDSMVLLLDSAKSFGNPFHDELSILAPLYQCCMLRESTYEKLVLLQNGVLSQVLRTVLATDPISPILTDLYYKAMDRRMKKIIQLIHKCIEDKSKERVLLVDKHS